MKNFFKIILILFLTSFITTNGFSFEEKLKIGLLVPMTGDDKDLGSLIIKSTRMALEDINTDEVEIFPKDTNSNPKKTLKSALEF